MASLQLNEVAVQRQTGVKLRLAILLGIAGSLLEIVQPVDAAEGCGPGDELVMAILGVRASVFEFYADPRFS